MNNSGVRGILLVVICIALVTAGCTSSDGPAAAIPAAPAAATTTPACPDTLVWDGEWQTAWLGMAGNHDLSTAWTKYKDSTYGYMSTMTMKQTCWDVETTLNYPTVQCVATMKGTIEGNVLSGTWSAPTMCSTKSETGRKFSLTMAADNKSFLGDFYSDGQDPSKFPPNLAGRRPVK